MIRPPTFASPLKNFFAIRLVVSALMGKNFFAVPPIVSAFFTAPTAAFLVAVMCLEFNAAVGAPFNHRRNLMSAPLNFALTHISDSRDAIRLPVMSSPAVVSRRANPLRS